MIIILEVHGKVSTAIGSANTLEEASTIVEEHINGAFMLKGDGIADQYGVHIKERRDLPESWTLSSCLVEYITNLPSWHPTDQMQMIVTELKAALVKESAKKE